MPFAEPVSLENQKEKNTGWGIDHRAWPASTGILFVALLLWVTLRPLAYAVPVVFLGHLLFFRVPPVTARSKNGLLAPASGTVVEITDVYEDRYLQQDAVRVGIFLSVFNEHVNYSPVKGKVEWLNYVPGKFMNALNPLSARENESNWIGINDGTRKVIVRQISGAIARRICCDVELNQELTQGQKLGIIRYGSRVEFYAPKSAFKPTVKPGQKIIAGQILLGEWA